MMTFPIDFHIAGLVIDTHLVFEILAYLIGFKYYSSLRKKAPDKITSEQRLWIIIGGALAAAIFSKLLGFLEHPANKTPFIY